MRERGGKVLFARKHSPERSPKSEKSERLGNESCYLEKMKGYSPERSPESGKK